MIHPMNHKVIPEITRSKLIKFALLTVQIDMSYRAEDYAIDSLAANRH